MAVTLEFPDGEVRVELAGVVLDWRPAQVRVSSDHAMIDSGNRVRVDYWDAENWKVATADFCPDDVQVTAVEDAPESLLVLAEKYRKGSFWFYAVLSAYGVLVEPIMVGRSRNYWTAGATLTNVRAGDRVEVYKGRKCPKGLYEIADIGQNDYGDYVHLRDAKGTWHRFINPDNLKRPAPTEAQLAQAATGGTAKAGTEFHALVTGILHDGNKAAGWLALTDWLQERGKDDEARILRSLVRERYQLRPQEVGV
jgi:hypothetical protein